MKDLTTPRPWQARQEYANRWRIESPREGFVPVSVAQVQTTVLEVGVGEDWQTGANAGLIVRAVNAHDDLVAALKAALAAHELVGAAKAAASDKLYGPGGLIQAALAKVEAK